jgi:hypothetical protein
MLINIFNTLKINILLSRQAFLRVKTSPMSNKCLGYFLINLNCNKNERFESS